MSLDVTVGTDSVVATIVAGAALIGSWRYTRARSDANRDTIEVLQSNLEAIEQRRKIDTELHESQVAELTRQLETVRQESRVLQTKAVDRLVALVADAIAAQTREVMVEIRQHLTSIDATTRTIRRGMGTRLANGASDDAGDDEE